MGSNKQGMLGVGTRPQIGHEIQNFLERQCIEQARRHHRYQRRMHRFDSATVNFGVISRKQHIGHHAQLILSHIGNMT